MRNHLAHQSVRAAAILAAAACLMLIRQADAQNTDKPADAVVAKPATTIKDYGLKEYLRLSKDPPHSEANLWKLVCTMPYNCHFQPWIELEAPAGKEIRFNSCNPLVLYLAPKEVHFRTRCFAQKLADLSFIVPPSSQCRCEIVAIRFRPATNSVTIVTEFVATRVAMPVPCGQF